MTTKYVGGSQNFGYLLWAWWSQNQMYGCIDKIGVFFHNVRKNFCGFASSMYIVLYNILRSRQSVCTLIKKRNSSPFHLQILKLPDGVIKLSYTDQKKLLLNFLKFKLNKRGVSFLRECSQVYTSRRCLRCGAPHVRDSLWSLLSVPYRGIPEVCYGSTLGLHLCGTARAVPLNKHLSF